MPDVEAKLTPEKLKKQFFALKTFSDVANFLDVDEKHLKIILYRTKIYKTFYLKKKSGGIRKISAPNRNLKSFQKKLNAILQIIYLDFCSVAVQGFTLNRSIVTNAKAHSKQSAILNLDLKDFFPTINFGRVRGLFINKPFNLLPEVATVLAQICCFENSIPQGSPTSPIISNFICLKLDRELNQLAKRYKCFYTRYADDITFSHPHKSFRIGIVKKNELGQIVIGQELEEIIVNNGFQINEAKVRVQKPWQRQEVTGLIVNDIPNLNSKYYNQVRAMLHAWKVYGETKAQEEYLAKFDKKKIS